MAFSLNIVGLSELQNQLRSLPKSIAKETAGVVEAGAKKWVRDAKRDSANNSFDKGILTKSISYAPIGKGLVTSFKIVSGAKYSPYIEWGTITKVSVPAEETDYAIQFKGKGIRKTGGVIPRPFFFKQRLTVEPMIYNGIKAILDSVKL